MSNRVKELRESQLMSKAELARKAGLSPLTVDRIEAGQNCRLDTKRKIILALGMTVAEKDHVFTPGAEPANEDGASVAHPHQHHTGQTPAPQGAGKE
jgi:DNA-binding XRE family transcriptional regulator